MTGVSSDKTDMLVYISASHSQKRSVLSPTRLQIVSKESCREYSNVRLIVGLGISDCLLTVPPVCQCEDEAAHVPVDVLLLLQPLDVQIRHSHCQSVVKSNSTQRQ